MKLFLYVLLFFMGCNLYGQSFSYLHWTTETGLPSNTIYDIKEMPDGSIALGTDNGLSFFNGTDFKSYFTTSGLRSNFIIGLDIGEDSTLYIGNYKDSVQTFKKGVFKTLPIHGQTVFRLTALDTTLIVHIGTNGEIGLLVYSHFFDSKTFKPKKYMQSCFFGKKSALYPYTKTNYNVLKYKKNTLTLDGKTVTINNKALLLNQNFESIIDFEASDSTLVLLGLNYVYITDWNLNLIKKLPAPMPQLYKYRQIVLDKSGGIWCFQHHDGLYYCSKDNDSFSNISLTMGIKSDENIDQVFCDSKGRLWIGTYDNGLYCIPNVNVRQYDNEPSNFINSVLYWNGKIWASSRNSLFSIENQKKQEVLKPSYEIFNSSVLNGMPIFLCQNPSFALEKNNNIHTASFKKMIYSNDSIVVFASHEGGYLIARLDRLNDFFKIPTTKLSSVFKFFNKNTKLLALDKYKEKYYLNAGFRLHLCRINNNELIDEGTPSFWRQNWHTTDFKSYKNKLYVSTDEKVFIIENNKIINKITEVNGVKFGVINSIKITDNVLWVLTSNGLFKYALEHDSVNFVFNQYNVLKSPEVSAIDFDNKGNLFVATRKGLTEIPIDLYSKKTKQPDILVNAYSTTTGDTIKIEINQPHVKLNHDQSFINFYTTIRNFNALQNRQMQYRIDGASMWNNMGLSVAIPLVTYGSHTIEFRVRDVNSDWAETSITLTRELPFYYKKSVILGCILLLILLSWLYYKHLLKQQQKRQQEVLETNNRISELRQSALATMMNPHFLFNALNAIQYFINSNQKEKSSGYLAKLSRLVRKFLNHASEPYITLQEELERLSIYVELELLRFNNGFKFIQDIQVELPTESINLPNMILQPFIENAIIHGISRYETEGFVKLSVQQQHKHLTITIEDNGPGIDLNAVNINKKHASKAIGIIKERLQILQKMYPKDTFEIKEGFVDGSATERKGHRVVILLTIK